MLSCEPSTLKVLVVDDHELTRFTLKLAFSSQKNLELVGLASNGQEAVELFQRHRPDVVVMDLQMPIMDGWSASLHIKGIDPHAQIIAYSSLEDIKYSAENSSDCLDAFCKKDTATPELIALVRELGERSVNR
jgi:DNA-binding NarL/FixJ family response regulator